MPESICQTMKFEGSKLCQEKAHRLIPGGAHVYAKGDDQYPVLAPGFIERGSGCHVWDVDGNEFIEYGMGLRAVSLGHGYRPVVEAAYRQMQRRDAGEFDPLGRDGEIRKEWLGRDNGSR